MSRRPLGTMERGIWRLDRGARLNFTTVSRISGPLTADALRAALPALRARHSHLRARIVPDAVHGAALADDGVPPLTLRVVDGSAGHDAAVIFELEREINEPFVADPGPLARFLLVTGGAGETTVLVTLQHVIGDGMSGAFLVRDWMQAAAQVLAGGEPMLPPLADPGALEGSLPPALHGLRAFGELFRFGATEAWMMLRHGRAIKVRRDADAFAHSRRSRVISRELDEATTAALVTKARSEKTTVHGALSAALVLGVLDDARAGSRGSVAFGSPVNVRARLEPAVGEQSGFFVSMIPYRSGTHRNVPFWDVARTVRRGIESELARSAGLSALKVLPAAFSILGADRLEPRALVERLERLVPTTTGLTNLGRLAIEPRHGPLFIENCWFAACPSALGDFMTTSTSLNGRIRWNFVWSDPVFTEAHATALAADIVRRLEFAVRPPA